MRYVDNAAAVSGELRKSWGWLLAWGVLLVFVGFIGLSYEFLATAVAMDVIGLFLIALGVIEIVQAFKHVRWAGFFLFLVGGLLSIVTGFMVWYRPLAGMAVITLFMASYFLVLGAFRLVGAIAVRHPGWVWGAASGLAGVVLGILIFAGWPASSLWVIGLFVSISLLFQGWNYVMLALVARRAAEPVAA
ncbi:MAG: DUF308 domain-containing protein [Anaeromyxobacteraceae bacterium]